MPSRTLSSFKDKLSACREQLGRLFRRLKRLLFRDLPRECAPKMRKAFFLTKRLASQYWTMFYAFLHSQWEKWQPKVMRLKNAAIAITTATTTLKLSIETTPIIFSVLTVLATAPLLGYILPSFLFEPAILFPIIFGISVYVGYFKYLELMERAKLDHQITTNQSKIKTLFQKINRLEQRLERHHPQQFDLPLSKHRYKPTASLSCGRYKPTARLAPRYKATAHLEKELGSNSSRKMLRH